LHPAASRAARIIGDALMLNVHPTAPAAEKSPDGLENLVLRIGVVSRCEPRGAKRRAPSRRRRRASPLLDEARQVAPSEDKPVARNDGSG
jgi:hypothetical protein